MADAFIFSQAQFQRILSNYLGLEGAISIPHNHHCGGGAVRVLMEGTVNHLQVCPVLGRLAAADGRTYDADVVYFDPSSGARVILEVSIVTIGFGSSLGRH